MLVFSTLLFPLVLLPLAHAIDWQQNDWDSVWAMNCDFKGNDIDEIRTEGPECGKLCWNNKDCSHFTYYQGVCYLKQGRKEQWQAAYLQDAVCGILKPRGEFRISVSKKVREMNRRFSFDEFKSKLSEQGFNGVMDDFHYQGAEVKFSITGFESASDRIHAIKMFVAAMEQYKQKENVEREILYPAPAVPLGLVFRPPGGGVDRWNAHLYPVKFNVQLVNSEGFVGSLQVDLGSPTKSDNSGYCEREFRRDLENRLKLTNVVIPGIGTLFSTLKQIECGDF